MISGERKIWNGTSQYFLIPYSSQWWFSCFVHLCLRTHYVERHIKLPLQHVKRPGLPNHLSYSNFVSLASRGSSFAGWYFYFELSVQFSECKLSPLHLSVVFRVIQLVLSDHLCYLLLRALERSVGTFFPFLPLLEQTLTTGSSITYQSAYPRMEIKHGMLTQKIAESAGTSGKVTDSWAVPGGSHPKRVS